ncbi:unnamed protein product [Chondrus crispus]|uniref:S-adenosylmethionine:tRNA ribosyltransferase-isomerase n=1 Tax=Chondrus crispus TaxID=2769 RepID=R7QMT4_CHOCR|nr:unnamed protein product [Chondrus crispus]CDF39404.1 unnamed protein product [Chondrus crispus]|eukprot:XP_005719315.1 unnamed protein product [Chondrus crispus]
MEDVVLLVGAGTFAPVTAETVGGHGMHAELMSSRRACVERVGRHVESRSPIVAMGTTSVRALESMYWFGDMPIFGTTQLLIVPKYPFKMVDAIITNFHQPRSTLLMLVSAFLGGTPQDLFNVYQEALDRGYRFLSYGDSCIFARPSFFER